MTIDAIELRSEVPRGWHELPYVLAHLLKASKSMLERDRGSELTWADYAVLAFGNDSAKPWNGQLIYALVDFDAPKKRAVWLPDQLIDSVAQLLNIQTAQLFLLLSLAKAIDRENNNYLGSDRIKSLIDTQIQAFRLDAAHGYGAAFLVPRCPWGNTLLVDEYLSLLFKQNPIIGRAKDSWSNNSDGNLGYKTAARHVIDVRTGGVLADLTIRNLADWASTRSENQNQNIRIFASTKDDGSVINHPAAAIFLRECMAPSAFSRWVRDSFGAYCPTSADFHRLPILVDTSWEDCNHSEPSTISDQLSQLIAKSLGDWLTSVSLAKQGPVRGLIDSIASQIIEGRNKFALAIRHVPIKDDASDNQTACQKNLERIGRLFCRLDVPVSVLTTSLDLGATLKTVDRINPRPEVFGLGAATILNPIFIGNRDVKLYADAPRLRITIEDNSFAQILDGAINAAYHPEVHRHDKIPAPPPIGFKVCLSKLGDTRPGSLDDFRYLNCDALIFESARFHQSRLQGLLGAEDHSVDADLLRSTINNELGGMTAAINSSLSDADAQKSPATFLVPIHETKSSFGARGSAGSSGSDVRPVTVGLQALGIPSGIEPAKVEAVKKFLVWYFDSRTQLFIANSSRESPILRSATHAIINGASTRALSAADSASLRNSCLELETRRFPHPELVIRDPYSVSASRIAIEAKQRDRRQRP